MPKKRKPVVPPCPHCGHALTADELRSMWGAYRGSLQTPHAGPGRPPSEDRCPCGAMTKARAKARNHKCS
jgi:hypothetical protein